MEHSFEFRHTRVVVRHTESALPCGLRATREATHRVGSEPFHLENRFGRGWTRPDSQIKSRCQRIFRLPPQSVFGFFPSPGVRRRSLWELTRRGVLHPSRDYFAGPGSRN